VKKPDGVGEVAGDATPASAMDEVLFSGFFDADLLFLLVG